MKLITLNLPDRYLDGIEILVREEIYPNRSEAIRTAIRDFLRREADPEPKIKNTQKPFLDTLINS